MSIFRKNRCPRGASSVVRVWPCNLKGGSSNPLGYGCKMVISVTLTNNNNFPLTQFFIREKYEQPLHDI